MILSLVLAVLALPFIAAALIVADGLHDRLAPADVAVVLGCRVNPDGTTSGKLAARLERALEIYRLGLAPVIITSGAGDAKEGHDEAKVMKGWLVERGVPAEAVVEDGGGVNTRATAINTVAWMRAHGARSVIVVSQYFHISRIRLAFRQAGAKAIYNAHASHFGRRDAYSIVREVAAYGRYMLS